MNKHHKKCWELLQRVNADLGKEHYGHALMALPSLKKILSKAEACEVTLAPERCSCGDDPVVRFATDMGTIVDCSRCGKVVRGSSREETINDWNNAVYAFKVNKHFPKRCTCGSEPHCDTFPNYIDPINTFRVKCLNCKKFITAESVERAIESWNTIQPDYIEPVKEGCGNCRFWHRLRNVLRLKEKGSGVCRKQCTYHDRFNGDWCGDWEKK